MTKSVFRQVPKTGVIFTTSSAMKLGFYRGHPDWCNFGQGQPETGYLEGGLERISHIDIDEGDHEYALIEEFHFQFDSWKNNEFDEIGVAILEMMKFNAPYLEANAL